MLLVMGTRYTEEEAATIRSFVRRRVRERDHVSSRLLARARSDSEAIVERLVRELGPVRIYQWGSLIHGEHFCDRSDIDLAVEGVADPLKLFELSGELQRGTAFDLDIVRLESVQPVYADHIRRRGRIVHEREAYG
jgi:predicted nucleotidyltransferase